MRYHPKDRQCGLSLTSLIIVLVIVGAIAVLGMKVGPTVTEYYSVKKAIVTAKNAGSTEREIRNAFDRYASAAYIESIRGANLSIERVNNAMEVSFFYEKRIPLFGPTALLIEYEGTTANSSVKGSARKK